MTLRELRDELACARDLHFLNYAGTAPMLTSSAETMREVAREGTRPMGEHFERWLGRVEASRRAAAEAIGARADEITFTTNTSTALSLAAGSVRWRAGDRILYPADEYPSNRYVWENLRDLGVQAEPVPPEMGVGFAAQLAGRDLEGVRLVALSAVSFRDGRRLDVEEVCRLCRSRGIWTVVDAIQAVGAVAVDARAWGCDFLACGGQKWLLGPVGSAFLYVARERLVEVHVPTVGWASSRHAGDHDAGLEWCAGAARYEAGLPDVAAIAGLGSSLDRLAATGWDGVFAAVAERRAQVARALRERGLELRHSGEAAPAAGIVTCRLPADRIEPLERALARRGVIVTVRKQDLRVASHAITGDQEVEALLAALDEALGKTPSRTSSQPLADRPPGISGRGAGKGWSRALITGASRGLGAAFAESLARRGTALILLGRDTDALAQIAARLSASHDVAVESLALDLGERAALERWIAARGDVLDTVDLLINNAAFADASPFLEEEPERERAAFEVNLFAPRALARAVLGGMMDRGRGAVLNVATTGARNALPLFSSYAASKAALWAWSEALGRELQGTGVTVTTFVPPHMDTATLRQLGRRALGAYAPARSGPAATRSLDAVAERGLGAVARGRRLELPRAARWQIALNVLFPAWIDREVGRRWQGLRRRAED